MAESVWSEESLTSVVMAMTERLGVKIEPRTGNSIDPRVQGLRKEEERNGDSEESNAQDGPNQVT